MPYKKRRFKKDYENKNEIGGSFYFYLHIDWYNEFQDLESIDGCRDLALDAEYDDGSSDAPGNYLQNLKFKKNMEEELEDEMDETSSVSSEIINSYLDSVGLLSKANVVGQQKHHRIKEHKRVCGIQRNKEKLKQIQKRMYRKRTQTFRMKKIKRRKDKDFAPQKARQQAKERIMAHSEKAVNKFENDARDIKIQFRANKKTENFVDYSDYYYDPEEFEEPEEELDEQYQQYVYSPEPKQNVRSKIDRQIQKVLPMESEYSSLQKTLEESTNMYHNSVHDLNTEMEDIDLAIQQSLEEQQKIEDIQMTNYDNEYFENEDENGSENDDDGEDDPLLRRALEESIHNFPNLTEEEQLEIALAESLKMMEENFMDINDNETFSPSARYVDSIETIQNETEINTYETYFYEEPKSNIKAFPGYAEAEPPKQSSPFDNHSEMYTSKRPNPFSKKSTDKPKFYTDIYTEHHKPNFHQPQHAKQAMDDFEYCQKLQEEENLKKFQPQKKKQTHQQKMKKNNEKQNGRGWETMPNMNFNQQKKKNKKKSRNNKKNGKMNQRVQNDAWGTKEKKKKL